MEVSQQVQEQKPEKEKFREAMINIPIQELLDKANGSMFKLCNLAAKRALELNEGAHKLIDGNFPKITTMALEEIRQGKVKLKKETKSDEE